MMKRISSCSLIAAMAFVLPLSFAACDRTVSEKVQTHTDSQGNVSQKKEVVKEDPAGNVTVQKEQTNRTVDSH